MYKLLEDMSEADKANLYQQVRDRLPDVLAAAKAKGWRPMSEEELAGFFTDEGRDEYGIRVAILDGGYCLLYTINETWWLKGAALIEQFLLGVQEDRDFKAAMEAMKELAADIGCSTVHIGTAATSNKAYVRLLGRYGFTPQAVELVHTIGDQDGNRVKR